MITTLCPALAQSAKKGKKASSQLSTLNAKPKIYLCTPIPAFKSSWNISDEVITNEIIPIQKEVAQQYGLQIIDLHTLFAEDGDNVQEDGIHPNDKGVAKMAEIIADEIKNNQ